MHRENSKAGSSRIGLLVNGCNIYAEVADTPTSRTMGLMHRGTLEPGCGMLFVFPDAKPRSFWMKETHVPLSIAYLNEHGLVLNIEDMEPHNLEGVKSAGNASYALEMARGWFSQHGVLPGDTIKGLPGCLAEHKIRAYVRELLMEVPLDDFEYLTQDDDNVMVREEVADYFKAIPQSVNIYVAHTDDLSWAHRLPNEIQGKVSGFKSRGQVTLTDISNIGKLYPQIQRAMNPEGINLLYVYPKSFEVPAGGDTFIADVNPHYLAHDLHHMIENAPGRERGEKDKFTSLIKEYLMELVWLSHGGGSMEAEQVRNTMRLTGRRLGVANTNLLMSELFPGIKLPSGDFDLFGDVFADYLKNDGNLVLGVPEQLDYKGTVIELNPDSKHDQRAQQYEKKFKDLFDTVLDPLKGKVAMFNIFEVEHRGLERARKQAEEKMQVDHGPLIDHIKAMGGEFKYFDESHREEGVEELIFDTGLKPEKAVMGVEEFTQQFPKEAESIESLGYRITSAFDGFGSNPIEIRLKKVAMNETLIREYINTILRESFLSHSYEPIVGDAVINTNPQCKHYKSKGVVVAIDALPGDAGKTILYQATNGGDNWAEGDVLEKTMDQLDQDS